MLGPALRRWLHGYGHNTRQNKKLVSLSLKMGMAARTCASVTLEVGDRLQEGATGTAACVECMHAA